jgi:hypothetical protein
LEEIIGDSIRGENKVYTGEIGLGEALEIPGIRAV